MRDKYKALNGLRGVTAIIIAYLYHYKNEFNNCRPMIHWPGGKFLDWLYEYGWAGVDIFFYISGIVIYLSYYQKVCEGGGNV